MKITDHKILALKYRPKNFEELIGQDVMAQTIINSIKFLNSNGIIILHDCLPTKIWNQIVPRIYKGWNGDVWKAIVEARTMKNIDTYTCKADNGLGIILKRPNRNLLTINTANFKKLKFKDYYTNHKSYMNLIEVSDIARVLL